MNWTAILALLSAALFIVNLYQLFVTRHAIDAVEAARGDAALADQQRIELSTENAKMRGWLADAERRARRRSRRSDRAQGNPRPETEG